MRTNLFNYADLNVKFCKENTIFNVVFLIIVFFFFSTELHNFASGCFSRYLNRLHQDTRLGIDS
jgi:hypothetical protein